MSIKLDHIYRVNQHRNKLYITNNFDITNLIIEEIKTGNGYDISIEALINYFFEMLEMFCFPMALRFLGLFATFCARIAKTE